MAYVELTCLSCCLCLRLVPCSVLSLLSATVTASVTLHNKLLGHILRLPKSFFDTNPAGRVLNRFSKDIETMDSVLNQSISQLCNCFATYFATLIVISIATKWFGLAVLPITIVYIMLQVGSFVWTVVQVKAACVPLRSWLMSGCACQTPLCVGLRLVSRQAAASIGTTRELTVALLCFAAPCCVGQRYYIPTARELQRLESVTRSPIYSKFSEALAGVATIRAYRREVYFTTASDALMELNAAAFVSQRAAAGWLALRLDVLGVVVILLTGKQAVCMYDPFCVVVC